MILSSLSAIDNFFSNHPALKICRLVLVAVFFIEGLFLPALFLACTSLVEFFFAQERKSLHTLISTYFLISVFIVYYGLSTSSTELSSLPNAAVSFSCNKKYKTSFYGKPFFIYEGKAKMQGLSSKSFPLKLRSYTDRYDVAKKGLIKGIDIKKTPAGYSAKLTKSTQISYLGKHLSLVKIRYQLHRKISKYLTTKYKNYDDTASLMKALCIGRVDDKVLKFHFSRAGLSHLLAISGFHFALIAGFFTFILKRMPISKTLSNLVLVTLLTIYILYLGDSPSALRAYLMICLYILAKSNNITPNPLNLLGFVFLISFFFFPHDLKNIGHTLSYLATLGILLGYSCYSALLKKIYKHRTKADWKDAKFHEIFLALSINFLRTNLALSLSVFTTTFFVIISSFGSLSTLGLIFNLFIPFLFCLTLFLLLTSLTLEIFSSYLSSLCHKINLIYSSSLLDIISSPPLALDIPFTIPLTQNLAVLATSIIIYIQILIKQRLDSYKDLIAIDLNYPHA